jgi:membrane-associated phospholipid phosphatase
MRFRRAFARGRARARLHLALSVGLSESLTATTALRKRNDRLLVVAVLAYTALVVVLMVAAGVAITPDVMAVAFGLAAVLAGRGRLFVRDWIPFIVLLLAYELMRGFADDVGMPLHAGDLARADRFIGLGSLPTQVLQDALHPASGVDAVALVATLVYMLHFTLPILTGFALWLWRRPHYYDFVAALIVLSMAGFTTYLLLPAAPPWYVADQGLLNGPDGTPVITYLKPVAFDVIANALGFDGHYVYSLAFGSVNPNLVAAFPSLHCAYPFLSFLVLRRAFGRIGWLALGYTALVMFSVIYTGDHWLIDGLAGIAYAYVAYYAVIHAPAHLRRLRSRRRPPRSSPSPS